MPSVTISRVAAVVRPYPNERCVMSLFLFVLQDALHGKRDERCRDERAPEVVLPVREPVRQRPGRISRFFAGSPPKRRVSG